jgi:uncharacterized membrane protein
MMSTGPATPPEEKHVKGILYWLSLALSAVLLVALIASVCATAYLIINPAPRDHFTELYLLGPAGVADGYPRELVIGEHKPVQVYVTNHEGKDMDYDLIVFISNGSAQKKVYLDQISLADNATWDDTVVLSPDIPGDRVKAGFQLFRHGETDIPYRECHLWMNVSLPYNYGNVTEDRDIFNAPFRIPRDPFPPASNVSVKK